MRRGKRKLVETPEPAWQSRMALQGSFGRRRAVERGDRDVVQPQIDAELRAVVEARLGRPIPPRSAELALGPGFQDKAHVAFAVQLLGESEVEPVERDRGSHARGGFIGQHVPFQPVVSHDEDCVVLKSE